MTMTYAKYFEKWFETYREPTIKDVTAKKYLTLSRVIDESKLGQIKLKQIKRKDVQAFINEYGSTRRKKTVLDARRLINASFVDAVHDGLIKLNPCARTEIVSVEDSWSVKEHKKIREEKKWLEIDEYNRTKLYLMGLLNVAFKQDDSAILELKDCKNEVVHEIHPRGFPPQMTLMIIYVALKTGARFGEIVGLTKKDIDFKNGLLNIDKSWDYKYGTGFIPTKTLSSIREITVDREFLQVMKSYFNWIDKYGVEFQDKAIFVKKGARVHNPTINRVLTGIFDALEIERITLHKLRHTHASILIAEKVSLRLVAKRLGHTDTNMIQSVYGHLLESVEIKENKRILELI